MTVVVIGGTGFIGRRLVPLLVARGEEVLCMDINRGGAPFDRFGTQVRVVRGDVSQFDDVAAALAAAGKPERVINLAYALGSEHPPHPSFKLNVLGMENCFEAARLAGVNRVAFASSLAVNGAQQLHGDRPVTEDDPRYGPGQYAMHKIFNEWQAEDYREKHGMEITAIRPANVTGNDKLFGSVDHVHCITDPARGRPVSFPYKDTMRCPIHVDEVAEIFARVIMEDSPRHSIYNTGGHPISLGGLAELVCEYLPDAQISFEHEVGGQELAVNPLMDCYLIDNSRLVEEFGVEYRPYRERVLQIIDEVRAEEGLPSRRESTPVARPGL
jgi:nucleoside-diphosphate-sugar epimerase